MTLDTGKFETEVYCMHQLIRVFYKVQKPNEFIVNLALDEGCIVSAVLFFHNNSGFGCLQFLLRELQEL